MNAQPTRNDLEDVMREFVIAGSGLSSVVWADQNAPRIDEPFIRLSFLNGPTRLGQDAMIAPDEADGSDMFLREGPRNYTLSCRGFGQGIKNYFDALLTSCDSRLLNESLRRAQVATLTITGSGAAGVYSALLEGITVSITTATSKTLDQIAALLMAEINTQAASLPIPYLAATYGAMVGVVSLTALPGVMFNLEGSAHVTAAITTRAVDLSILDTMGVTNATEDLGSQRDIGETLDIEFSSTARAIENIESIETVEVEDLDGETFIVTP